MLCVCGALFQLDPGRCATHFLPLPHFVLALRALNLVQVAFSPHRAFCMYVPDVRETELEPAISFLGGRRLIH